MTKQHSDTPMIFSLLWTAILIATLKMPIVCIILLGYLAYAVFKEEPDYDRKITPAEIIFGFSFLTVFALFSHYLSS